MTEGSARRGRAARVAPRGATLPAARSAHPRARRRIERWAGLVAVALVPVALLGGACGGEPAGSAEPARLTVFAAASLTEAYTELSDAFAEAHPGTEVTLNFAGAGDLVAQLQQGAPADVLATADPFTMAKVRDLVDDPDVFAGNSLAIAVANGNPERIEGLADLSRPDLDVVLGAESTAIGRYGGEILDRVRVAVGPVSLEMSVKGVVTKVALGETDAGLVFVTDVQAARGDIDAVAIPRGQNVITTCPIAVVSSGANGDVARRFVDLVLSDEGRAVLAAHGFLPPPAR